MIVCSLHCQRCGYESDPFVERHSVHSATYTVICANSATGEFRIASVKCSDISPGADTDNDIETLALRDGEQALRTHAGQQEELPLTCPACRHYGLTKETTGIE